MRNYFWYKETVAAIIHHFILRGVNLYDVSDLAQLSDAMIDGAASDIPLSTREALMLKQLRDAQQTTPEPEPELGPLAALLTQLRDI